MLPKVKCDIESYENTTSIYKKGNVLRSDAGIVVLVTVNSPEKDDYFEGVRLPQAAVGTWTKTLFRQFTGVIRLEVK